MQLPDTLESVREYYGNVLQSSSDLKTDACCSTETLPGYIKNVMSDISDDVMTKFYGCGSPLPQSLAGASVLDLGCGSGRDVYVASKLVGASGSVIGVDMTDQQLAVARRNVDYHTEKFQLSQPNVDFRAGFIEDLSTAGISDNSIDVVISNCVINLSPDKSSVFSEILRVLRPGGELYFSDVFADRRIPSHVAADPILYGECLGGALYYEDFRRLFLDLGINDVRVVSSRPIEMEDEALATKLGNISFTSKTIRVFNLGSDKLEDQCENYGQLVKYLGTIPESPNSFTLDDHHFFERGLPVLVCGNTAAMIQDTRYGEHFEVMGDRTHHYGLFDCAPDQAAIDGADCGC